MVVVSRREIDTEIYLRLAAYRAQAPNSSPSIHNIKEWLAQPNARTLTPEIKLDEGWVTRQQIEFDPCPYAQAGAHRHKYLRSDVIEQCTFRFYTQKQGVRGSRMYAVRLYRLCRDAKSKETLRSLLGMNTRWLRSDYVRDLFFKKDGIASALRMVEVAVQAKQGGGLPNTPDFKNAVNWALERLKKELLD